MNTTQPTPDYDFWKKRCYPSRYVALEMALRLSAHVPGHVVEFGVAEGHSTRSIKRFLDANSPSREVAEPSHQELSAKRVYACDSFEGLPEKYENLDVGAFACEVPVIEGVQIVKGFFEDSLTPELATQVKKVSFAHLDADLYSSTLCALTWLTPMLQTGTVLLFDEFLGGNQAEKRAFLDWVKRTGAHTVKVAEFGRPPSGHGNTVDKRTLFQVIRQEDIPADYRPSRVKGLLRHQVDRFERLMWH